jgi:hypothetical protein
MLAVIRDVLIDEVADHERSHPRDVSDGEGVSDNERTAICHFTIKPG